MLVDVLDFAHQRVPPRGRLPEVDQAIMNFGEKRSIFFAQQPQLRGAGSMREGAALELERLHDSRDNEGRRRERRRGDQKRSGSGQRQKARARGQSQDDDENDARLTGAGIQPFGRSRVRAIACGNAPKTETDVIDQAELEHVPSI